MSRRSLITGVLVLASWPALVRAEPPSAAPPASVIDEIATVDERHGTFLPKYRPEWFFGAGYQGTFQSKGRMWPAFAVQLEAILLRPARFDFGLYVDGRWGRPDEDFGRFSVGLGPEMMWRFYETSIYDFAAVVRGTYELDLSYPSEPRVRPQVGVQASLVRSIAAQLTYDPLISFEREFSTGNHVGHGLSVLFKMGLCPWFNTCAQVHVRPTGTLDRSPVACRDSALACRAARSAKPDAPVALCGAALRALDPSRYPTDWGDPVGAFLRGLRKELSGANDQATSAALDKLQSDHAASLRGIDEYAERIRRLEEGKALSSKYSYVVTPVMVRDWLGCSASGEVMPCASEPVCDRDTGVDTDWGEGGP